MLLRFLMLMSLVVSTVVSLLTGAFDGYHWLWLLPLVALGILAVLIACTFGYLVLLARRVDFHKEQDGDDPHYRKVAELVVESAVPLVRVHVKSKGLDKVPAAGRFMLVSNHVSLLDPVPILYALPGRQLAFVAKQEVRGYFLVGALLHKLQGQFINRENDREALKSIIKCIQILKEDKGSIAVFPEGGIHDDRKFHHFRPGVFKIAQKAKVPVVVCTLKNTRDMLSNLQHFKRSDIEFSVLTVIYPEEHADLSTTELADRVYKIMAEDLGPENVAEE